ncbi:MAG: outer membrane protein assembly factor BamE [Endomicrobiaceae bacterium]|nr:outer membrane protein assembly factor BamE [Endomicrobiaceae bacterium]
MKNIIVFVAVFVVSAFLLSCASTTVNKNQNTDNLSIAKVQREIKTGMSSAEVVEILGSPNMVTTDDQRRETWVYDKISTQVDSSSASSGVWILIAGAGSKKESQTSSQRTLTIIIKFDNNGKVRDFAYRTSSF